MECGQVQESLSALVDGELPEEEAAHIETHLETCPDCRQAQLALQTQNADLRERFLERRQTVMALADRVNREIERGRPRRKLPRWLPLFLSAAAGFLIAVGIFQPWRKSTPVDSTGAGKGSIAQRKSPFALMVARSPVDVLPPGQSEWVSCEAGQGFEPGCRVRTKPDVRCEIQTSDSSEIRLNGGTEVLFQSLRQLEVTSGQIMARVAKDVVPFQVAVAATTITALGTEFDISCKPAETTLLVLEGSTSIATQGPNQIVNRGEFAKIVGGKVTEKNRLDPMMMMLATRWVNEILVMKGRDNPELATKIDDIMAQLGQIKGEYLGEQEIRSLGDRCVIPLTRYLQSIRCQGDNEAAKRSLAARVLSDLAPSWSVPDLITLLSHSDGAVRVQAAKALERITGVTQGQRPEFWRRNDLEATRPVIQKWKNWWRDNQSRFPGAS